jgi:hypothetical protein
MNVSHYKSLLVFLLALTVSHQCSGAFAAAETPRVVLREHQPAPANESRFWTPMISDRAVEHLSRAFTSRQDEPVDAANNTKVRFVQAGPATVAFSLVGFLCISLVRDRRVWVAVTYMLVIHPVIAEARNLDHLARHVHFEHYAAKAVEVTSWHTYTPVGYNRSHSRLISNYAASFYRPAFEISDPFQAIQPGFGDSPVFDTGPCMTAIHPNVQIDSGRSFMRHFFSLPPPMQASI